MRKLRLEGSADQQREDHSESVNDERHRHQDDAPEDLLGGRYVGRQVNCEGSGTRLDSGVSEPRGVMHGRHFRGECEFELGEPRDRSLPPGPLARSSSSRRAAEGTLNAPVLGGPGGGPRHFPNSP